MADLMTEQIKKPFAGAQGDGRGNGGDSDRKENRREAVRKSQKARMMRTKEREANAR